MTTSNQSFQFPSSQPSQTQTCQVCGKLFQNQTTARSLWDRTCCECFQKQKGSKHYVENVMTQRPQENVISEPKQGAPSEASQAKGRGGVKDDGGKLMWNLLPWKAVQGLVKVLTFGARKYAPNGWRSVPNAKERYQAALLRHLYALSVGETVDSESGLRHIDHLLCNAAFLAELED